MITPSTHTPTTGERVNGLVTEAFQTVTIALIGVLGILTLAATF
jgi:hypothetical protein